MNIALDQQRARETPASALTQTAALCKAAGDPLRMGILRALRHDAFGVLELCHIFAIRQPAMSHHLKILAKAALVVTRREGTSIFYRRVFGDGGPLGALRQQLLSQVDTCSLPRDVIARIEEAQQNRAERSRLFFHQHAAEFRKQQDLIASHAQYGASVLNLLDAVRTADSQIAVEIGPGEGELLLGLSARFQRVIALDNAPEMLARSQRLAQQHRLGNIDFVLGDIGVGVNHGLAADVVTLNMVLHHTPSPAAVIAELGQLLSPAGSLIVTELCRHDQDWARTACGDLWLGFEAEELSAWAQAAGLEDGESLYLAQRNGFRIQIRHFRKPTPPHEGRQGAR
ncbi:MAG: ArsR/SmtB family transcription factor [Porticoccaceae bacterium]